ncbi:MAG: hypothetical protein IT580_16145, partial [Verrucomicrobiales bacterium]|nr:hypothetical protein [Verrucomicrobiales bacterium]
MLNDADHDLLRRDTALPALRTLLEEDAFLARLQSVNPTRHLTSARLRYLRYKPGTSCLASYLVRNEDREYHVSGKAWLPGSHAKREKHQGTVLTADPNAFQGGAWPDQGLVIGVFPWDAKLGSLDHWATPDARHQFFAKRESLRSLAEAPGWTILNYKPERRLVARVERNSGDPVAVLKAHTPQGLTAALAASRAVEAGQRFDLPRLLGKSTHHAAAVYAWQNGEGMDALLGQALADSGK